MSYQLQNVRNAAHIVAESHDLLVLIAIKLWFDSKEDFQTVILDEYGDIVTEGRIKGRIYAAAADIKPAAKIVSFSFQPSPEQARIETKFLQIP